MKPSLWVSLGCTVAIALIGLAATLGAGWAPKLGLDLAGGAQAVFQPVHRVGSSQLGTAVNIMRERVDGAGVSNANIGTQGNDIVVQMPGVKNADALINQIGQTAQLEFRPVLCFAPPYTPPKAGSAAPTTLPSGCSSSQYQLTAANLDVSTSTGQPQNNVGADPALASYPDTPTNQEILNPHRNALLTASASSGEPGTRYLLGPVALNGSAIAKAQALVPQNATQWVVDATLTSSGSPRWDSLAEANFHQYIGIVLNGQVISAPLTQPDQAAFSSFQGHVEISGNFTQSSANTLAQNLNYGALPVPLKLINNGQVSATLGRSSLKAGLLAGLGGLILVLLYMILYYRALGIVVVLGLTTTSALLWAIVSSLSHSGMNLTLDLAGVTGLIVSIGITADSYVIYFERLKDQARAGRSLRSTVDRSFAGAFRTVLAADLVSLIGALVLWTVAIGSVRGFAFFLGLSTLVNIGITYFFTRPLVVLLARSRTITEARFLGIARGLAPGEGT